MNTKSSKENPVALIPFLVFLVFYLGSGLYFQSKGMEMPFYVIPVPIAAIIGVLSAFILLKGSTDDKFNAFLQGSGDNDILIMCIIYLLAGAFSTVTSAMGGVDATVSLGLALVPPQYITAGVFVISCMIALAMGTSCGTIAAVTPIAFELATKAGLNVPLVIAAVVGGGMFGDNLSIISDTTIAATRTQGVEMRDKFKMNFLIALPAAIGTIILLIIFGRPTTIVSGGPYTYDIIKVLPYAAVLVLALVGVNVFAVLLGGIALSGIIGIFYGDLTFVSLLQNTYSGFLGMIDLFLASMFIGGLAKMVTDAGGIEYLMNLGRKMVKGKKSAELAIAALVSLTDLAIANNTVAIILTGPLAKELSEEHGVDPRRVASLLDIFSCVVQGIIPYGAQLLIAGSLTMGTVSPVEIIPLLWYQQLLALVTIAFIFIAPAGKFAKKEKNLSA